MAQQRAESSALAPRVVIESRRLCPFYAGDNNSWATLCIGDQNANTPFVGAGYRVNSWNLHDQLQALG